ncbi:hypothetical protein [Tardiphaga sp. P9-11]|uniref:hypothetical protein n=1 Tax=Tardiphaga sp. P9-11 TaxID=2024614 RepID=UPI0011F2EFDE|nr:hypothetical protein [Tardiphaga sp. P9-11]KAA0075357.1 hypothetical protein CIW50_15000 [Tardiphaga sp. P9-11]
MQIKKSLVTVGFVVACSNAAIAQAPPMAATPPAQTAPPAAERANANCAPTQTTPRGTISPNGTTTGQSPETLGDKLAKSDGVLCPPSNIDPAMRAPAPNSDSSNTPVIPPPGSPGGDQSIRPK